jgi:hypothetical protein
MDIVLVFFLASMLFVVIGLGVLSLSLILEYKAIEKAGIVSLLLTLLFLLLAVGTWLIQELGK